MLAPIYKESFYFRFHFFQFRSFSFSCSSVCLLLFSLPRGHITEDTSHVHILVSSNYIFLHVRCRLWSNLNAIHLF